MTHTVDTLMALADAYAEVSTGSTTAHAVEMQEALRTALTEVFDQLDIQAGSIEAVQAANQRLAQAAQPVREPAQLEQSEREAFEAYALKTVCTNEDLQQRHLTGYWSQELNYLWRGWSARASLQSAQTVLETLTDEQIETLRDRTFSINNPFCPVDSKSMRKAVRAVECAHGIGGDK